MLILTTPPAPAPAPAIPVDRFGKDHWSLLAYVETVCVDGNGGIGAIDRRKVRSLIDNGAGAWREDWGTRLAGYFDLPEVGRQAAALSAGKLLPMHDDWACLEDLETAGLVEQMSEANSLVRLTDAGQAMASQLRIHKQTVGGYFSNFRPAPATVPAPVPTDEGYGAAFTRCPAAALMTPCWTEASHKGAMREGWVLSNSAGSDNGDWQIQRVDDADWHSEQFSFAVPQLGADEEAWRLVLTGVGAHHVAAREFIKAHNPQEWVAMTSFADGESTKAEKSAQDRG